MMPRTIAPRIMTTRQLATIELILRFPVAAFGIYASATAAAACARSAATDAAMAGIEEHSAASPRRAGLAERHPDWTGLCSLARRHRPAHRQEDRRRKRRDPLLGQGARRGPASIPGFLLRYPHQAMNNQTPMAVWRAGMDKIEAAARAVDMPLRLDNANALPTYPQQKQQEAA